MKLTLTELLRSDETRQRFLRILIFAMRTGIFYMAFVIFSMQFLLANHDGKGQTIDSIYVTVEMEGQDMKTLLKKIENQTNLRFLFLNENIDNFEGIYFPKVEWSVKQVLDYVMSKELSLTYVQVDDNYIIIKKKHLLQKKIEQNGTLEYSINTAFEVTGTVKDASTQQPLPGVNIIIKGTVRGTTTNAEGRYSIDVETDEVLVFTFIGYRPHETKVSGRSVIDVTLEVDIQALQVVEVNAGYYTTSHKTKTGNIVRVTSEEIENQPVTSPLLALQGRVTGVEITPTNGTPGSATTIRIRGDNSLRRGFGPDNGNYPLYIIDGVPIISSPVISRSSTNLSSGIDPLSSLSISNIESIDILKDADATAIYGSRGANGVILITTKKPARTQKTNLDLSIYRGVGEISNKINLLNREQYLDMRKEAFQNDGAIPTTFNYDVVLWDTTRNTDWQEKLLGGTANFLDVQANITGGTNNTSFRIGGGTHKESLITPGNFGYKRISGHFGLNHLSNDNRFSATISTNYGVDHNELFNGTLVNAALTLPPVAPKLYNEDKTLNWETFALPSGFILESWTNPLSSLRARHIVNNRNLTTSSTISYKFLHELRFGLSLGYTDFNSDETLTRPISLTAPNRITSATRGSATYGTNKRQSWILEPQIIYENNFGDHSINTTVGGSWQDSESTFKVLEATGYTSDALIGSMSGAASTKYSIDDFYEYKYIAVFGRIGYIYKNKYLLNLTGRRDGSSRFSRGKRFGNFGAIGLAWIFSNESIIKNSSIVSFGKLRISYGITGNDQIGNYKFYDTYSVSPYVYLNNITLTPDALYNPNFGWETTQKLESSIELGFLDDRLSTSISWYRNRSSNQLVDYKLPATTGFQSILSNFNAMVENSGWEILFTSQNIRRPRISWTTSINISVPKNKLLKFPNIEETPYANIYKVGQPLSIDKRYIYIGVNPETGLYDFQDVTKDGVISTDDQVFRNPRNRKYYGGISNNLRIKAFELAFLIQFSNQKANRYMANLAMPGTASNQAVYVLERWKQEGDVATVQKFNQNFNAITAFNRAVDSDYNEQDASFIRLKTFTLAYYVPSTIVSRIKLSDAKIYIQGQNLLTKTDFIGLDPETGTTALPPLRMISVGAHLKF